MEELNITALTWPEIPKLDASGIYKYIERISFSKNRKYDFFALRPIIEGFHTFEY